MNGNLQFGVTELFDGEQIHRDVWLTVADGIVTEIKRNAARLSEQCWHDGLLIPGFVDLQVNGGGDRLFNQQPTVDTLERMVAAHHRFGTTAMLPTLITDSIDTMQRGADAIALMCNRCDSGIVGVHFEGPHIAHAKRGAHNAEHIRTLSEAEWQLFGRTDLGVKLLTVAPETVTAAQISRLTELGVIVSLGHSDASYRQATDAVAAGASGFTHLYNAMSPLQGREPGMVGAALTANDCYAGIICDGLHVDFASIGLAYRCLGAERLLLVTDAMPPVGGEQRQFSLVGNAVELIGERLIGQHGELAGSALTMERALQLLIDQVGVDRTDALKMATSTPATWIKQPQLGRIKLGVRADMLLLNRRFEITQRWRGGKVS